MKEQISGTKNYEVLMLSPFFGPNIGGVETHLDDWCRYLSENNVKTLVVTLKPITIKRKALSTEERGSVKILRYKWVGGDIFHRLEKYPVLEFLYLTPYLLCCALWTLLVRNYEIKVIHAHGLNAAVVGLVFKKIAKIGCILSTHAIYDNKPKSLTARVNRWVIKHLDKTLCLSEASLRQIRLWGVPKEKVGRFTYWVNQKIFRPLNKTKARRQLGIKNCFSVLFVGRLLPIKGVHILLQIAKEHPEWNFIFVGTGPLEKKLRQAESDLGNVFFFGSQSNEKLPVFYNAADVLVVPSQYEEGFARVIIEAMSCGCPVIASRRGGIVEALSFGGGDLVEVNQKAIVDVLLKYNYMQINRDNIVEIARKYFSKANARNILETLRKFTEQAR